MNRDALVNAITNIDLKEIGLFVTEVQKAKTGKHRIRIAILATAVSLVLVSAGLYLSKDLFIRPPVEVEMTSSDVCYIPMSYEDVMHECDVLFVGKCLRVKRNTPEKGFKTVTFRVVRDLGGNLGETTVQLVMRSDYPIDEYETGDEYLLPLDLWVYGGEKHFAAMGPAVRINLTQNVVNAPLVNVPDGMTLEEYSVALYWETH